MTVGYLASSFDLINVRDLDLIAQARQMCSRLVVGVFTDEFTEQQQGCPPIVPLAERLALLSHMRGVHEVVVHDGSGVDLGPGIRCFSIYGEQPLPNLGEAWVLRPTRETTSPTLREALARLRRREVA